MTDERVAMFGGTFDPPHVGHLIVAEYAASALELDRVIWMPCSSPPHKIREGITPAHDRLKMVRLAIEDNDKFELSRVEIDRGGRSFTVDTLQALRAMHPRWDMHLLVGSDNWGGFHDKWYKPEEVIALAKPVVYPRGADSSLTLYPDAISLSAPLISVSSTEIRRRVKDGLSVRYMVSDGVREYIMTNSIYS